MLPPVEVTPPLSNAFRYSSATDLRCSPVIVCVVRAMGAATSSREGNRGAVILQHISEARAESALGRSLRERCLMPELPDYADLPSAPNGGRSAWGLFGADDNVGL